MFHEALYVDERARFLLAHGTTCIAHDSMNMHPGDLRSIEEQRGADSAQKEETSLIDPPHVSEMTKTLIHIEAGGSFLVGILISRFRRILFVLVFGAVYAIAYLVFVCLLSLSNLIGRGLDGKGANSTDQ